MKGPEVHGQLPLQTFTRNVMHVEWVYFLLERRQESIQKLRALFSLYASFFYVLSDCIHHAVSAVPSSSSVFVGKHQSFTSVINVIIQQGPAPIVKPIMLCVQRDRNSHLVLSSDERRSFAWKVQSVENPHLASCSTSYSTSVPDPKWKHKRASTNHYHLHEEIHRSKIFDDFNTINSLLLLLIFHHLSHVSNDR
jgi:hypothetical protein